MYLKSITLKGFKSFPDRTTLEFGPGVSVVVGPNGSGKSNLTDAVLWALGEQSPLAVRGQSMQDVIFSGAPGRQAASGAEVELVLDDSEGALGLGFPEVSIVRRLGRTGEGEYRLSGARCRLVDVMEVLSDTGLGKEMHSVVSQGRVESIVNSKPRDRRLLIEEAAGLGKHRKRRRRAQLKLARTQENLDRALDLEREARLRLRPLKRQAEAAELHARLERQMLEIRWALAREEVRIRLLELERARAAAGEARASRAEVEGELDAVSERRQAAEEALASRSARREELSRRCFVAGSAADRVGERAVAVEAALRTIEERLERASALRDGADAVTSEQESGARARERIETLEAELEALERDRQVELARQLSELQRELDAARSAAAEREAVVAGALEALRQAEERVERSRTRLREAEGAVEAARREAARVGGELAAVNQFLRSRRGLAAEEPLLADELQVSPGYELAVAAALGGRLRAAVVPDRATAAAVLDRAGADGGRTLVTGGSPPLGQRDGGQASAPAPGADPLAERIDGAGAASVAARELLRDTWVVSSLDDVEEGFTGVAVTRSGRVWSPRTGELRQVPALGEERVLEQRNRREHLLRATEVAVVAERTAADALEHATAAFSGLETDREHAIAAHRAALRERDDAAERERRLADAIERRRAAPEEGVGAARRLQVTAELSAERAKLERAQQARDHRRAQRERLRKAIAGDEALLGDVRALLEALDAAAHAIDTRREAFQQALEADRQAGDHVAGELRACAQREAALHAELHRRNEALTEAEVRLQRERDRAAEADGELRALAAQLGLEAQAASEELGAAERESLDGRLARLGRRREQLGPINPLAEREYVQACEHVEELERQRQDLQTALRELEKLISDTDHQIRESFERTFNAAAENFERVVAQLFPGGRGRLALVAERDGPARVLGGQPSDAGDEARAEHEGGDSWSGLDEEDALGVEIEITPAGKEMKRLTLLSGGEKSLTALAFLFAVFLARPCPFYILDEVEAALDDLNIDRFLALLRGYSSQAQFIVVTHQKRTMEAADFLYGVSMGGEGVSKVISRRLPPAEQAA